MSMALLAGCLWVMAATGVACLPLRFQYIPGLALLVAAPVIIALIGRSEGWVMAGLSALAVVSMFRKPLRYYLGRLFGAERAP